MKNTKSLKMNKLTKSDYHNDVIPAFVAYRKRMEKACKVKRGIGSGWNYARIFTEQRVNGARSKYWYTQDSLPVTQIETYVMNNPTFTTAAGRVMEVDARWVCSSLSYYRRSPDFALFCKLSK